jgi:hypothetical protein
MDKISFASAPTNVVSLNLSFKMTMSRKKKSASCHDLNTILSSCIPKYVHTYF